MRPLVTHLQESNSPIASFEYNEPEASCQDNSSLDIRTISENYIFKVYPNCVEYHPKKGSDYYKQRRSAPRGNIQEFSKKSRFRLFHLMSKIDNKLLTEPLFITLTYHHGHHRVHSNTKGQLHHFLVRLRQLSPHVEYIWRIELQKRGAPHYHLIIFPSILDKPNNKINFSIMVSKIWHSIADPDSRAHKEYGCKIKVINSYREACAYISKYVGKYNPNEDSVKVGRHWGNSRNLPFRISSHVTTNRSGAKELIEILRRWLMEHGKKQYACEEYFNIMRPQVIFISSEMFEEIRGSDKTDILAENYEVTPNV
ncbi:hypothetical protein ES705_25751 [subsurface metagenome]